MPKNKIYTAIGLMSGTSLDGIDVALIKSDGQKIISCDANKYYPYSPKIKNSLTKLINNKTTSLLEIKEIELEITQKHIAAVKDFLAKNKIDKKDIDVIGFHGQTILHHPQKQITWQIGNAQMLASQTGIDVVADFRTKDLVFGGQGAPLVPIYHSALFADYKKPLLVLNIGGVTNLTYIKNQSAENLIAFDVCFGNAPLNDLIVKKTGKDFDKNGLLASSGKVNQDFVKAILALGYFKKQPPKSLDRNQFDMVIKKFSKLKMVDILASLVFVIGQAVNNSLKFLPEKPLQIIVCGGGRKNLAIMDNIKNATKIPTINIDDLEIDGDFVEAEAFGFLAIRNFLNLPISYPKTTGILPEKRESHSSEKLRPSSCGGVFYRA
ncbi:MAG: anhydro-N-acetylmuramic acid kinase [Pseudomonadota bacterium]